MTEDGKPKVDATGAPVMQDKMDEKTGDPVPEMKDGKPVPFTLSYAADAAIDAWSPSTRTTRRISRRTSSFTRAQPRSSLPHGFSCMFIQACVAILILVGFESVTSMGEEAKNAKRDIPRAVLLSLMIQGAFCYLDRVLRARTTS